MIKVEPLTLCINPCYPVSTYPIIKVEIITEFPLRSCFRLDLGLACRAFHLERSSGHFRTQTLLTDDATELFMIGMSKVLMGTDECLLFFSGQIGKRLSLLHVTKIPLLSLRQSAGWIGAFQLTCVRLFGRWGFARIGLHRRRSFWPRSYTDVGSDARLQAKTVIVRRQACDGRIKLTFGQSFPVFPLIFSFHHSSGSFDEDTPTIWGFTLHYVFRGC